MNKLLITDIDDTLLHWYAGFQSFMEKKGYTCYDDKTYYIHIAYRISEEEALEIVEEFNRKCEDFAALSPLTGSVDALKSFHDNGYKIICISSCGDFSDTIRMREDNLLNIYGDIFEDIICLPVCGDKTEELSKFSSGIWVEDNAWNAEVGSRIGLETFLINQPWNIDFDSTSVINRCNTWEDIVSQCNQILLAN